VDAGELALAAGTRGRAGTRVATPADLVPEGAEEGGGAAGFAATGPRADRLNINRAFGGTLESSAFSLELLNLVDERLHVASGEGLARVAAGIKIRGSSSLVVYVLKTHQVCAEKGEKLPFAVGPRLVLLDVDV
jgi:hypothetical protein